MDRRTALKGMVALSVLASEIDAVVAEQSSPTVQANSDPKRTSADSSVLANIRLYNPTRWTHPTFVEVPVGELGTPGLIDWHKVRLMHEGQEVPFSIREGRAHWKASLRPVTEPRAEDLIVFAIAVPSDAWAQLDLVRGERQEKTALRREGGRLMISYPDLKVAIDEISGMLLQVEAFGEALLEKPLSKDFFHVGEGVVESVQGSFGYTLKKVAIKKGRFVASPRARLVSSFSDAAMSELNFVFEPDKGPVMCLTYRVYAGGLVEILADERPWEGLSPWLNYGIEYKLSLHGEKQRLPQFENRIPVLALHDYAQIVNNIGVLHRGRRIGALEVGEEFLNGRRWRRRLYLVSPDQLAHVQELLPLVEEGLAVEVTPMVLPLDAQSVQVLYPDGCQAIAATLVQALRKTGFQAAASTATRDPQNKVITLKLVEAPEAAGLEGDGFAIRLLEGGNGASIVAGTKCGLMAGTWKLVRHLRKNGSKPAIPLIAGNPVVGLRGCVVGTEGWQGDFPLEASQQWTTGRGSLVFDDLIASGMNVITCVGMWGGWRMPVTYKYMPELRSDSPDAYDEVSGSKFSEIAADRKYGLALLNYLRDRGVKVWLWVPVGAIPSTFADKFPEAILPGMGTFRGRHPKAPRVMHPKYREYLRAFFKEVLETYPVDGIAMCKDDNGGADNSEEFKRYVAASRTKDPVWEQFLMVYDLLRASGFRGEIAAAPYGNIYKPSYESALPKDFRVVCLDACYGLLVRDYTALAPMYDTWFMNIYGGFRLPTTAEMKRQISDRSCYWSGGAYRGTELPWEAIGQFGWRPANTVNTLRYDWGARAFGEKNGLGFLHVNRDYERLWNLMNDPMMPYRWLMSSPARKKQVEQAVREGLTLYRQRLAALRAATGNADNKDWFAQVNLYSDYVEYCLRRLEIFSQMHEIGLSHKDVLAAAKSLPSDVRQRIGSLNGEMLKALGVYQEAVKTVPGRMMRDMLPLTDPYMELGAAGFGQGLDAMLQVKQFAGRLTILQDKFRVGHPFTLAVELYNGGFGPWIPGDHHYLRLDPAANGMNLPHIWDFTGESVLPGDRRVVNLSGTAPKEPGTLKVRMKFAWSSGTQKYADWDYTLMSKEVLLKWE